jgi:hypothetical protein
VHITRRRGSPRALHFGRAVTTLKVSSGMNFMKRLVSFGLVVGFAASAALAQDQAGCRSGAQLQRDQCNRQTAGDNTASRRCMSQYLSAVQRCQNDPATVRTPTRLQQKTVQPRVVPAPPRGRYDPLNPVTPPGRFDTLNPPVLQSDRVRPGLNR